MVCWGRIDRQGSPSRFGVRAWYFLIPIQRLSISLLSVLSYRAWQRQVLSEARIMKSAGKVCPILETGMFKQSLSTSDETVTSSEGQNLGEML